VRVIGALVAAVAALAAAAAPAGAATIRAQSILPPGNSGFVSVAGLPSGTGSPHLYDQQPLFVDFRYKEARLHQARGESEQPRPGVSIVRDAFGVPSITGQTDDDLWWGAGYATAQDRLFELEVFRRATTGRLAEVLGRSYLAMDVQTRRDFYTPQEVRAMLEQLPPSLFRRYESYTAGINAWVQEVRANPEHLPGEYPAVNAPLREFSLEDMGAIGIYLARTTPNDDGIEMETMRALQESGARALDRILPLRVRGQVPTIPRDEGVFPSVPGRTRAEERAALRRSARFVRTLPLPAEGELGSEPALVEESSVPEVVPPLGGGGSLMAAIGDRRHRRSLFFSGPQLGYSAPEQLYELELHGPTLHIRGMTAPGAPVIALGHNDHVAYGVTSGLTMTDHLYAEKLVEGRTDAYEFRGETREMQCREETFSWRSPPTDATGGDPPESGERTFRLCRTHHGPVQARAGGVAYARRYATWGREHETLLGIAELMEARSVYDAHRAISKMTWNENMLVADERGNIGYWHPGLLPISPEDWDERLPYPGTGEAEWRGFLPVRRRPYSINPRQGWLTNWNNIPSHGWTTGNAPAHERVAGPWFRVAFLNQRIRSMLDEPTFNELQDQIRIAGTHAQQRPLARRLLHDAIHRTGGKAGAVLATILGWDGNYHRTDANGTIDPGAAAWQELKRQMQTIAIEPLGAAGKLLGSGRPGSSHRYDVSLGQAYALRTLSLAQIRRAAELTFDALTERFGSDNPSDWRDPRLMYDVGALGAAQPEDMPFFDRGTYELFAELRSPAGTR
jgi:penicillin G amidase